MSAAKLNDDLRCETVRAEDLESFLPLIEAYQRFFEVSDIDRGRNRGFFGRLIAPNQFGALLGAWLQNAPIGFACLHWSLNSVQAHESVQLHDIWVQPGHRGEGIGRHIVDAAADLAHARGASALVWLTSPDNIEARRLSDSLTSSCSSRLQYSLRL